MASATVTHAARGRIRIRIQGSPREVGEALRQLESHTSQHEHVNAVGVDVRRGSALLEFDPEQVSVESVIEMCRAAHGAFHSLAPPRVATAVDRAGSQLSSRLRKSLGSADRRVLSATGGAVDLRMLVPIGFAALAVRQLLRTGPQLSHIPWYVVSWYAFDSFVKLHGVQPTLVEGPAA